MPEEWKESINLLYIRRAIKQSVEIIGAYHFANHIQSSIQHPAVKVNYIVRSNYWGIINVDLTVTGQLLIIYSAFVQ